MLYFFCSSRKEGHKLRQRKLKPSCDHVKSVLYECISLDCNFLDLQYSPCKSSLSKWSQCFCGATAVGTEPKIGLYYRDSQEFAATRKACLVIVWIAYNSLIRPANGHKHRWSEVPFSKVLWALRTELSAAASVPSPADPCCHSVLLHLLLPSGGNLPSKRPQWPRRVLGQSSHLHCTDLWRCSGESDYLILLHSVSNTPFT